VKLNELMVVLERQERVQKKKVRKQTETPNAVMITPMIPAVGCRGRWRKVEKNDPSVKGSVLKIKKS